MVEADESQNMNKINPELLSYRLIGPGDFSRVLDMMIQSRFPISGLFSKSLYRALCRDAIKARRIMIGLAEWQHVIAAIHIFILDWKRYWQGFMLRHPLLAIRMIWLRLGRRRKYQNIWEKLPAEIQQQVNREIITVSSGRSWHESSPHIAKGVFIYTDPKYRRRGIAGELYRYTYKVLVSRGIKRMDATVDLENIASLRFHREIGYRIEKCGSGLFATVDINEDLLG